MEITIMGHKAKIFDVKAWQTSLWNRGDFLTVGLRFNEAVVGIHGFSVRLPVKKYGKEEFLAKVKAEAEDGLSELLELDEEERERWMRGQERQEELDAIVDEIKSEIGLLP